MPRPSGTCAAVRKHGCRCCATDTTRGRSAATRHRKWNSIVYHGATLVCTTGRPWCPCPCPGPGPGPYPCPCGTRARVRAHVNVCVRARGCLVVPATDGSVRRVCPPPTGQYGVCARGRCNQARATKRGPSRMLNPPFGRAVPLLANISYYRGANPAKPAKCDINPNTGECTGKCGTIDPPAAPRRPPAPRPLYSVGVSPVELQLSSRPFCRDMSGILKVIAHAAQHTAHAPHTPSTPPQKKKTPRHDKSLPHRADYAFSQPPQEPRVPPRRAGWYCILFARLSSVFCLVVVYQYAWECASRRPCPTR